MKRYMKSTKTVNRAEAVFFPSLITLLPARILWQCYPTTTACVFFWIIAIICCVSDVTRQEVIYAKLWRIVAGCGLICNAAVTIINGGFMPCLNCDHPIGLWIQATDKHYLLALCDRFAGFSIGDIFIAAAWCIGLAGWLAQRMSVRRLRKFCPQIVEVR